MSPLQHHKNVKLVSVPLLRLKVGSVTIKPRPLPQVCANRTFWKISPHLTKQRQLKIKLQVMSGKKVIQPKYLVSNIFSSEWHAQVSKSALALSFVWLLFLQPVTSWEVHLIQFNFIHKASVGVGIGSRCFAETQTLQWELNGDGTESETII